jgi:phosphoribosylanthranilate isomerase
VRSGGEPRQKTERRFHEIIENEPYAVHFDTHVPGMWGGSGVVGDWTLAREFARDYPTFLAGGLDADNVRAAVCEVQPFVVDVSSGVETNNVKDHAKIKAFIEAAKCQEDENR